MMDKRERRSSQRFDMIRPAIVKPCTGANGSRRHLLLTRDISDHGAYFNSLEPMDYAGQVEVEVLFDIPGSGDHENYVHLTMIGEVVRADATGLAVRFNTKSSLKPFHI